MATINIIKYLTAGDNIKAQDEINSVLSQKAYEAITDMKPQVAQTFFGTQEESLEVSEDTILEKRGYSAKSAAAGKDLGKKGKNFSKIAKKAAEEYGSEESGKKVAGAILKKLRKEEVELEEGKNSNYTVYHPSYSSAIQHALDHTRNAGYDVNDDDVWSDITTGPGKPKAGETTKHHIRLSKNNIPDKKQLHIQVYNRDTESNPYELNKYIN